MKNRLLKTKLLTSLLALCMVVAVMPITAFAGVTDVTGGGTSTLYQHTYHTQIDTTAQVTIKDADGNVKETTSVNKSGDFIEGNLSAEAVQEEITRIDDEIKAQFSSRGTAAIENRDENLEFDHFESGNILDDDGNVTTKLDVHEYQVYKITYNLWVQEQNVADEVITTVDIGNVWKNLDSTKPVVFTTELNPNTDCQKQMEITDQAWVENDSSASISSNAYPEAGKEYVYEITLTAKEGYYFQTFYGTFDGKVIVDGVEKYSYGHGDAVPDVYDNGKTLKVKVYPAVIATNGTSQGDTTINNAYIENVKFDYRSGDAPQATAQVEYSSSDRYEVAYECWEEMENGEPVAFWYSDESKYTPSMKKITQFEEGKTYMYSIELREKDGYIFADNCSVTINWNPISATANVVKTVNGLFAMNVETIRPQATKEISVIEINNATLTFKDGDKPVFTGTVPENDQYAFRCEWWSLDENTGIVSTEPEWGGDIYTNKITAFEIGRAHV